LEDAHRAVVVASVAAFVHGFYDCEETRGVDVVYVILWVESQKSFRLLMGKTISRNAGALVVDYEGFSVNIL
jgi:hypothetical protein